MLLVAASRKRDPLTLDERRVVSADPADWIRELTVEIGSLGYQVVSPAANTVQVTSRGYFPAWTIVVSVLFFPIGLLSLLTGRKSNIATLSARDIGDGNTEVRFAGTFEPDLIDRANELT